MRKQAEKHAEKASGPAFLSCVEVARILRVHRQTVYRAIEAGEIPAVRVGKAFRIPASWLHTAGLKTP